MGNRTGIIFHENWTNFSPLLYSQHGGDLIPYHLSKFFKEIKSNSIGKNDCEKISVNFIKYSNCITRVSNLDDNDISIASQSQQYYNCFDNGIWFVNVSADNFGEIINDDGSYFFENNNIKNKLFHLEYEI